MTDPTHPLRYLRTYYFQPVDLSGVDQETGEELAIIALMVHRLSDLPPPAQARILDYLHARFGEPRD